MLNSDLKFRDDKFQFVEMEMSCLLGLNEINLCYSLPPSLRKN